MLLPKQRSARIKVSLSLLSPFFTFCYAASFTSGWSCWSFLLIISCSYLRPVSWFHLLTISWFLLPSKLFSPDADPLVRLVLPVLPPVPNPQTLEFSRPGAWSGQSYPLLTSHFLSFQLKSEATRNYSFTVFDFLLLTHWIMRN
jgi:hypothetical protein